MRKSPSTLTASTGFRDCLVSLIRPEQMIPAIYYTIGVAILIIGFLLCSSAMGSIESTLEKAEISPKRR